MSRFVTFVPTLLATDMGNLVMNAESNTSGRKQFRLSDRLTIEVWTSDRGIEVEWNPSIPRELKKAEVEKYQDAMAELFERLASDTVVMVDVGARREKTH